jgi:hypothetical protein
MLIFSLRKDKVNIGAFHDHITAFAQKSWVLQSCGKTAAGCPNVQKNSHFHVLRC